MNVGVDMIGLEYVSHEIDKGSHFIKRVFTTEEIKYCESQNNPVQHYAARLAGKEAVMKALGTGWGKGVKWNDIEVLRLINGNPYVRLHGKTKKIFENSGYSKIAITLTHYGQTALAFVIFFD
ncbi:holo-ACP synthase [Flagellimonas meridianipacifica]|uniref:Holo-[acyl-carrier-protein] synthase n=1 Tax=Flagellimonas meridianipacifica TaxID=1080225 RepID=A0A2T0MFQ2_9FLAO|nr:holo-ACP synthase [Allomuricauda pacifica]PRX56392.1 holo-[acyl-carrier protein] synthase [Allomuricauda pacifica]